MAPTWPLRALLVEHTLTGHGRCLQRMHNEMCLAAATQGGDAGVQRVDGVPDRSVPRFGSEISVIAPQFRHDVTRLYGQQDHVWSKVIQGTGRIKDVLCIRVKGPHVHLQGDAVGEGRGLQQRHQWLHRERAQESEPTGGQGHVLPQAFVAGQQIVEQLRGKAAGTRGRRAPRMPCSTGLAQDTVRSVAGSPVHTPSASPFCVVTMLVLHGLEQLAKAGEFRSDVTMPFRPSALS